MPAAARCSRICFVVGIRPASTTLLDGIAGERSFFSSATSCRPKRTLAGFRSFVVTARTSATGCAPSKCRSPHSSLDNSPRRKPVVAAAR